MTNIQHVGPRIEEVYHVYNRGVNKCDIFINKVDYIRFVHNLYEFNDVHPAPDFDRRYKPVEKNKNVGFAKSHIRQLIVEILAFCLMKNHYHILLRPVIKNGIALFMKKLNVGYANAFNAKYDRSGHLFQGRYKMKYVDNDKYFRHLVCYIHLNPLKILKKSDKNNKIDINKTWEALNGYRWSSHNDYLAQDNFGSILDKRFLIDAFGSAKEYKEFVKDLIKADDEKSNIIDSIAIDFN